MAKVCPLPTSTRVSARRTRNVGREKPETLTWLLAVRLLTSGRTCRAIRLFGNNVGVNCNDTPNGLYSTPIKSLLTGTGTGISPPARKFAVWPLTAVMFGSARISSRPLLCNASSSTSILALFE
ncbi:hypothetical protein D9M71_660540 [compost metagenome]